MRTLAAFASLTLVMGALTACESGPVFNRVTSVKVRHIGTSGLTETYLAPQQEKQMIKCLNETREIQENQALRDLLQTTYLLEIDDARGDRSFELYTTQNLKGNKGKYYVNRCVYRLIMDAQVVPQ
ncbi:MAG: hypothetical protein R3F61_27665 [Myxococcota bacterium]